MARELRLPLGHLTREFLVDSKLCVVLLEIQITANLDEAPLRNLMQVRSLWRGTIASNYMLVKKSKRRHKKHDEVDEWQVNYAFHWDI